MPADEKGPEAARVADLIGRTPLLRLDRIATHVAPGVRLFAKAEWHNPGGSVKDRAALGMIRAAQKDRKSTRLNSSHSQISYAVFCLKKKNTWNYRLTSKYKGPIQLAAVLGRQFSLDIAGLVWSWDVQLKAQLLELTEMVIRDAHDT